MSVLWTAAELSAATHTNARFDANGVSIDSRTLQPGELFVALVGDNGDGHDHVGSALARGAAGAMVHRLPAGAADRDALLTVPDTQAALRALGAYGRARFGGKLVAITGSVGKTTTKEMLRAILSAAGATHAAEASYNNHWGVPLTLARLPADAAFCIAEIGMNHAGEIRPLAELAHPDVAVITAVERVHIGHLGSIEAIAVEKASLRLGMSANGISILPADSPHLRLLRDAHSGVVVLFGESDSADVQLLETSGDGAAHDVTLRVNARIVRFRMAAPGRHMAMNAAAAVAAAEALGVPAERAAIALADFAPVGGRGARREIAVAGGTALLIDESYNASGASVRAGLAVLGQQTAARRVAVLGDMLELGDIAVAEHVGLASAVASSTHLLFTCGPLMQTLAESVPSHIRGAHAPDSATLAPLVAAALRPGDAVLVKGSLGSRMKRVVSALDTLPEPR